METGAWALTNVGIAGLLGAAGVALAAVAAHRVGDPSLTTAALFLVVHAAAVIGLTALAGNTAWPAGFLASASLMLLAVMLFSGDVTSRVLLEGRLFPMAAPLGGSLLILAWIGAGLTGIIAAIRGV
jgi:uncharacterized membrane protein YgdD (TMEM256/DUF423 family)